MKRLSVLALVAALWVPQLPAATLERLTLDEMIVKSTAIVRAKVTGTYTAYSGSVIYTHYLLQVSEKFKGGQTSMDVAVPGGTIGRVRQSMSGAPELTQGSDYVLFLWTSKSGITQVVGLTQGLFRIGANAAADPVATRAVSGELMLAAGTGLPVKNETLAMRVSELRSRIAATLGGQRSAVQ